jgi:hypothetical protein
MFLYIKNLRKNCSYFYRDLNSKIYNRFCYYLNYYRNYDYYYYDHQQ